MSCMCSNFRQKLAICTMVAAQESQLFEAQLLTAIANVEVAKVPLIMTPTVAVFEWSPTVVGESPAARELCTNQTYN